MLHALTPSYQFILVRLFFAYMTVSSFKSYISTLLLSHADIAAFVWGDAFDQLQHLMQGVSSPVALVDSPDVSVSNLDYTGRVRTFESELVILKEVQLEDKTAKETALDDTLEIITEVIRKLEDEYQNNVFENFVVRSNLTQTMLDNRVGWRFTFALSYDITILTTAAKWL